MKKNLKSEQCYSVCSEFAEVSDLKLGVHCDALFAKLIDSPVLEDIIFLTRNNEKYFSLKI